MNNISACIRAAAAAAMANVSSADMKRPYAGLLKKADPRGKNWKTRWIVLDPIAKTVKYYTDASKKKLKGEFSLKGASYVPPCVCVSAVAARSAHSYGGVTVPLQRGCWCQRGEDSNDVLHSGEDSRPHMVFVRQGEFRQAHAHTLHSAARVVHATGGAATRGADFVWPRTRRTWRGGWTGWSWLCGLRRPRCRPRLEASLPSWWPRGSTTRCCVRLWPPRLPPALAALEQGRRGMVMAPTT